MNTTNPFQASTRLILDFEVGGGQFYYDKFLAAPTQPTPGSGITIGIGYDLRQTEREIFYADWRGQLPAATLNALAAAIGLTHYRAAQLLPSLRDFRIAWTNAFAVFHEKTLPALFAQTRHLYPSLDSLPPPCQAALVSLVYNRGTSVRGDARLEMREIQFSLRDNLLDHVPVLIRSMKRLWVNQPGGPGLIRRREAEAIAFEEGLKVSLVA